MASWVPPASQGIRRLAWGIGAPIKMLLEPDFADSGTGSFAGRWETSLRDDDGTMRIENPCATSKTAVETDRSLCLNFSFKGPAGPESGRIPARSRPDPGRNQIPLTLMERCPRDHGFPIGKTAFWNMGNPHRQKHINAVVHEYLLVPFQRKLQNDVNPNTFLNES